VVLNEEQQLELSHIAQSRSQPAGYVFHAKLILRLAEGVPFSTIKKRLGTTAPTIIRWKHRFQAAGLDGLEPSRTTGLGVESEAASQNSVGHPQTTEGRFHSLELPKARRGAGRQQGSCASRVERGGTEAA
jgi:hypothetical protein